MDLGTDANLEFSSDPIGSPNILKMHKGMQIDEQLFSYDLVVVHYFNHKQTSQKEVDEQKEIFRNAIVSYREQLTERIASG